jgi:hypothetical protein
MPNPHPPGTPPWTTWQQNTPGTPEYNNKNAGGYPSVKESVGQPTTGPVSRQVRNRQEAEAVWRASHVKWWFNPPRGATLWRAGADGPNESTYHPLKPFLGERWFYLLGVNWVGIAPERVGENAWKGHQWRRVYTRRCYGLMAERSLSAPISPCLLNDDEIRAWWDGAKNCDDCRPQVLRCLFSVSRENAFASFSGWPFDPNLPTKWKSSPWAVMGLSHREVDELEAVLGR